METGTPAVSKIITMVLFALSCVGLLVFLWLSFGGTIPFNPQGYRFRVSFTNADQLATQADVRIAGVSVGRVIAKSLDPVGNRTIATIQLDNKYAPVRSNARAILRQKTILGETYVELTPGTPTAAAVPDNGLLSRGQVQPAVQLDEIFNAFDPSTRRAFQQWQQELAQAVKGNDQNLNDVLGNLPIFVADATDITRVLDIEHAATVNLLRNGGTVFAALSQNQAALRNVITSGEATFAETAANNQALADTFHVFPEFLTQSRLTMARLKTFSLDTDPLVKQLLPVARDLGPTLTSVQQLSPDLQHLFANLDPLITVSRTGLPATAEILRALNHAGCEQRCLLPALGAFLEQLNPVLGWLSIHQPLISDFISDGAAGLAAHTISVGGGGTGHYLRQFGPVGPETLSLSPTRDPNNRGNNYPPPTWLASIFNAGGHYPGDWALPSWDCANAGGPHPTNSSSLTNSQACWAAGPTGKPGVFAHILAAKYPGT
jgi:virulence factor Mce-like protein